MKTIKKMALQINKMLHIPVKIYKPVDGKEESLHLACAEHKVALKQLKHCSDPEHGLLTEHDGIVYYREEGNEVFTFDQEDFKEFEVETDKAFVISAQPTLKTVEPLLNYSEGMYYLMPDGNMAAKQYQALVEYLETSKKCLVGKFSIRSKEQKLGIVSVFGNILLVRVVPFATKRRTLPEFDSPIISKVEKDQISMSMDLVPTDFPYIEIVEEFAIKQEDYIKVQIEAQRLAAAKNGGVMPNYVRVPVAAPPKENTKAKKKRESAEAFFAKKAVA